MVKIQIHRVTGETAVLYGHGFAHAKNIRAAKALDRRLKKSLREWFRIGGRSWNLSINAQLLQDMPFEEQVEALLRGFLWRGGSLLDGRSLR